MHEQKERVFLERRREVRLDRWIILSLDLVMIRALLVEAVVVSWGWEWTGIS